MGKLCIIGIADGRIDNMTVKAFKKINEAEKVYLQTADIPFVNEIETVFESFDEFFVDAEDFDMLKIRIADKLIAISKNEDVVFCALGDLAQNEVAAEILKKAKAEHVVTEIIYGLPCACGHIGEAIKQGESKPIGVEAVSGYAFEMPSDFKKGLLIYEIDSPYLAGEIKIMLLRVLDGEKTVYIYNEEEKEKKIKLEDLDRQDGYGYAFSAYVPPSKLSDRHGFTFADLLEVMLTLRSEDGCPWDQEQTHESLKKYLLEESYEVFDAIEKDDMDMLFDELGDVLLQVVFHGQIGKEHREFDTLDITTAICRKMISRHPHVFGQVVVESSDDVLVNWEKIKEAEKGIEKVTHNLKDVPKALPSLMRSQKVQKRASACGFDWDDYKLPLKKVHEELNELESDINAGKDPEQELGDLLFAISNLSRHLKIEAEIALLKGVEKFIDRFEDMEKLAEQEGKRLADMTLDEMDVLWEKSKIRMKEIAKSKNS